MKHAVLITAHRSPELLRGVIDAMATSRTHVFVHIDREAPFTPSEVLRTLSAPDRVTMLEPRSTVHWRGYSYLSVVLRLLRSAHGAAPFDFYHLLSGQCFPTKEPDEILDAFEADSERESIECFQLPTDRWTRGGLDRMQFLHVYDKYDARKRIFGIPVNQGIIYGLVGTQRLLNIRRELPGDFETYHGGSVFWSLTGTCIDFVLRYLDEHPDLERGFENTYCPEEIVFQTVIANSPLADRISGTSLRYIDWTYRNGSIPANLDESDFEKIVESGVLFARKVDLEHSVRLLEQLRHRAGINKPSGPT
jgi:hypothetical protein